MDGWMIYTVYACLLFFMFYHVEYFRLLLNPELEEQDLLVGKAKRGLSYLRGLLANNSREQKKKNCEC